MDSIKTKRTTCQPGVEVADFQRALDYGQDLESNLQRPCAVPLKSVDVRLLK